MNAVTRSHHESLSTIGNSCSRVPPASHGFRRSSGAKFLQIVTTDWTLIRRRLDADPATARSERRLVQRFWALELEGVVAAPVRVPRPSATARSQASSKYSASGGAGPSLPR
jgi:hypothetical protein